MLINSLEQPAPINTFAFTTLRILLHVMWPLFVFIPFSMPIVISVLAIIAFLSVHSRLSWHSFLRIDVINVTLIMIWGLISALWSVDAGRSLNIAMSISIILAFGILLIRTLTVFNAHELQKLLPAFSYGMLMAFAMLTVELSSDGWVLGHFKTPADKWEFHKPAVILMSMIGPLLAYWAHQRRWLVFSALIIDIAYIQSKLDSDAVSGALVIAIICLILFIVSKRLFNVLSAILVIGCLSSPFIAQHVLTPNNFETYIPKLNDPHYFHRLYIWNYTAKRGAERFWTGFGMDASRHIQFKEELRWNQKKIDDNGMVILQPMNAHTISMHPHNAFLQWWLELGFIGIVLISILLMSILRSLHQVTTIHGRWVQACLRITPFVVGLIACVSYGIWQNWWMTTLIMTYAMVVLTNRSLTPIENQGIT